jgi:ferric-dicitrate binding protein FerR (iron transport regulator)
VEKVDTRLTTSWKDGRLIFKNTPLHEVTKQLERWFNCSIYVAPELLDSGILYTATIQDETLIEVLEMIEISTKVNTEIKNRQVQIME